MNTEAENQPPRRSRLAAWLQLLRAPNLLTVVGDPVMGFLLALSMAPAWPPMPWLRLTLACCVSLLLYCAGLIWNDLFDLAEDRRDRPGRPLAAGKIRPLTAAVAANFLAAMSVAIAAVIGDSTLLVTLALGLAVLAYNAKAKKNAVLGPLTMGLCRGLSVLVGASALGQSQVMLIPTVWTAAVLAAAYVAAVTFLAAGETRQKPVTGKAMLIFLAAMGWVLALVIFANPFSLGARWAVTAAGGLAVFWTAWCLAALSGSSSASAPGPEPHAVQQTVGGLIRGLILFQMTAVIALGWVGLYAAAALAICFLLNGLLAKRFYAS